MPTQPQRSLVSRLLTAGKILAVITVVAIAVYWLRFAPVMVDRHVAGPGEVVVEVFGTGTLEAHIKATVSTKIPGRLANVRVDQGDSVGAEQVLAQLDDLDLRHEVAIETANVTAHHAGIERLQADILHAKATFDLTTGVQHRAQKLRSTGAVSQEDFDKTVEALAVARAGQSRAEAALAEGRKQLIAAEKALDFRQARLADATIKAPFAGIVIRRDRNAGDVVVPGSSILALVAIDELWISAWVDETAIAQLRPGQRVRIGFRSEPGRPYRGKIVRIGNETDRETRETRVDIAPESLPSNWSVGQRADVFIELANKTAEVTIPLRFVMWHAGEPRVSIDANGYVETRTVTLGVRGQESVEIVDGLRNGDVVLSPVGKGSEKLVPGQRVVVP